MAVIGLLDIPPEIQLQIAQFVEANHSLKALSVTSRWLPPQHCPVGALQKLSNRPRKGAKEFN